MLNAERSQNANKCPPTASQTPLSVHRNPLPPSFRCPSSLVLAGSSLAGFLYWLLAYTSVSTETKLEIHTSCSRYHPQICMFPLLSSMHLVKDWVAWAQLLPQVLLLAALSALCAATGASGADEPPKSPPTALLRVWPTAEPTATPLESVLVICPVLYCRVSGEREAYAAVVAIWAKSPGPWEVPAGATGAAAGGACGACAAGA